MDLSQVFRYVDKKLVNKPGLHRFHWNLDSKGAWHKDLKRRYQNGPTVPPGSYTAVLKVGDDQFEQSFQILIDPRVKENGITESDIHNQYEMQNIIIDLLSETRKLQDDLEKEANDLKDKKAKAKTERREKLNEVLALIRNAKGAYPQQMLASQVSYLLNMISGSDQIPGQEAEDRLQELQKQLEELKEASKK
jgi:hypothetical protein